MSDYAQRKETIIVMLCRKENDLTAASERKRLFKQWRVPEPTGSAPLERFSSAAFTTLALTCLLSALKTTSIALTVSHKRWWGKKKSVSASKLAEMTVFRSVVSTWLEWGIT